jgi:hypothetical protein
VKFGLLTPSLFLLALIASCVTRPFDLPPQKCVGLKTFDLIPWPQLFYFTLASSVFRNRRDASRYRDLRAFLPGLEMFSKLKDHHKYAIIDWIRFFKGIFWSTYNPNLQIYRSISKTCYNILLREWTWKIFLTGTVAYKICLQPGLGVKKVEKRWAS